jgi:hypothetical protein
MDGVGGGWRTMPRLGRGGQGRDALPGCNFAVRRARAPRGRGRRCWHVGCEAGVDGRLTRRGVPARALGGVGCRALGREQHGFPIAKEQAG